MNALTDILKEFSSVPLQEIILDSMTVLVISIFFFGEMLIIFFQFVEGRFSARTGQQHRIHYSAIRPVFFLLLFGLDISVSFVPLYTETLHEPFFAFSKDIAMSLSVSVFVFFAGIAFLIAGIWNDLRGWYEPFFSGASLACAGHFYAWLAPDALHFIISRGISGMGYGLFFMASQGFIISYTGKNTKARGFALLFAALYSGNICGSATGAMLAERIGYSPVFFIGAIIMIFALVYTALFMRNSVRRPESHIAEKSVQSVSMKQVSHFIFNRNVLSLILLSSIPANMAMVGFTEYFNPVYLNRIGISQSNIGRTFMIYGFFQIYIGPLLSHYVDASENKKMYIFAGGILGSLAFLCFYFFNGIFASIVAILLLGFSQSFVFVSQATYLLKLRVSKELGDGKSVAIFRSANRIGQTIGPILFGCLIITMDISKGLIYLGISYLIITIFFLFFTQSDKEIAASESQATEGGIYDETYAKN